MEAVPVVILSWPFACLLRSLWKGDSSSPGSACAAASMTKAKKREMTIGAPIRKGHPNFEIRNIHPNRMAKAKSFDPFSQYVFHYKARCTGLNFATYRPHPTRSWTEDFYPRELFIELYPATAPARYAWHHAVTLICLLGTGFH